jgi:hypothetical protein
MVMNYTNQDTSFIKGVLFQFSAKIDKLPGPGNSAYMEFQFPPKITSDNRKGNWEEGELRGVEPVAVFSTSGARDISLKWTYIVDGGVWTAQRVSNNIKKLRGYFAQLKGVDGAPTRTDRSALVIQFKMWRHGDPSEPMSARIKSIDVKHGETIVCDDVDYNFFNLGVIKPCGGSGHIFPLKSDITVDFKLWSSGAFADESEDAKAHQDLPGLKPVAPPLWY